MRIFCETLLPKLRSLPLARTNLLGKDLCQMNLKKKKCEGQELLSVWNVMLNIFITKLTTNDLYPGNIR